NANVIVLGDLNDFQFSDTLATLKGSGDLELHALIETLEESERYTYVFDGNSQVLDHILFSDNLFTHFQFEYDVVHVNSEFPDQPREVSVPPALLGSDGLEIVTSPEIDIVVELIGGIEPARSYLLRALASGKSVVTANKALLAAHGVELFAQAESSGAHLYFEASVGGGIPLIKPISESLAAARLQAIAVILNGTTNVILTRTAHEAGSF